MNQDYHITLRLRDAAHVFQRPDFTPFSEHYYPHGSKPAIEQVTAEIFAHPRTRRLKLLITLPRTQVTPETETAVRNAVRRYADAQIGDARLQSIKTRDQATRTLPLAVVGLLLIAGSVPLMDPTLSYLVQLAGNGLSVAGWVAVWYPLDSLIFQMWLQRQESHAYRTLRDAEITVRAD